MLLAFIRGKKKKKSHKKGKKKKIEDNEDPEDYCPGGYMNIKIGDVFKKNYIVVGKLGIYASYLNYLGWGHFSTVWLCYDRLHDDFCALKVVRSDPDFAKTAVDEIELNKALQGCQGCIQMFHTFTTRSREYKGEKHLCMVFELAGLNLLSIIRTYEQQEKPLEKYLVKQIAKDILAGLFEMRRNKLIHTDIKPENILMCEATENVKKLVKKYLKEAKRLRKSKRKKRPRINPLTIKNKDIVSKACKLGDFGNATFADNHFTEDIQTRQYRAPEVILGQGYNYSADLWSFACVVFELITGDFLFQPREKKGYYSRDEDHIAQMIELIGNYPKKLIKKGNAPNFFLKNGKLKNVPGLKLWKLESVLKEKYKMDETQSEDIADFLCKILRFDPKKREKIDELIMHPWLESPEYTKKSLEDFYKNFDGSLNSMLSLRVPSSRTSKHSVTRSLIVRNRKQPVKRNEEEFEERPRKKEKGLRKSKSVVIKSRRVKKGHEKVTKSAPDKKKRKKKKKSSNKENKDESRTKNRKKKKKQRYIFPELED